MVIVINIISLVASKIENNSDIVKVNEKTNEYDYKNLNKVKSWPITYFSYLTNVLRPELSTYVNTSQVTMYPEFKTGFEL